jgi:hypothetical protein
MPYRDDLDAAHARIEALEHDLAEARRELAAAAKTRRELTAAEMHRKLATERVVPLPWRVPPPTPVAPEPRQRPRAAVPVEPPRDVSYGWLASLFLGAILTLAALSTTCSHTHRSHRFHSEIEMVTPAPRSLPS